MLSYLYQWGQVYLVHFGAWVTFGFACTIYKTGLPKIKTIPGLLKTAIVVAAILSIFSSHSHIQYMNTFLNVLNK
jgi:hypothetical protein